MTLYLFLIFFSVSLTLVGAVLILFLQEAEEAHEVHDWEERRRYEKESI